MTLTNVENNKISYMQNCEVTVCLSVCVCVSGTDSTSPQCLWGETTAAAAQWLSQVKLILTKWLENWLVSILCGFTFISSESSSLQREDATAPPGVYLLLLHPPWTQGDHGRQDRRSADSLFCSILSSNLRVYYYNLCTHLCLSNVHGLPHIEISFCLLSNSF